ncbi:hypothetical protein Ami103574_00370 [Aminipila butyrica]|uniref:Uncharacterized protein n=1 Tax=Aminipila butyrica TaxID=433296 RepID=A0A858BUV9_9FIRM|nr:hypothetical protein [Aminipila butyrica]QIB67856.1 hypothetical protein Ami103574_00370 [Aminipila butyrica]
MITEYGRSTIQYIENGLEAGAIGALLLIVLFIFALLSCIFLAFRRVQLWYWRVNCQVKALENIERNLEEIKHNFPYAKEGAQVTLEEAAMEQPSGLSEVLDRAESTPVEVQQEGTEFLSEAAAPESPAVIKPGYNIGKTGKVYAEELLREQIQF